MNQNVVIGAMSPEKGKIAVEALREKGIKAAATNLEGTELVSVSVSRADADRAVEIISDITSSARVGVESKLAGVSGRLLIPVDFSDYTEKAVRIGFSFARRLRLHVVLLHAYPMPYFGNQAIFAPDYAETGEEEIAEVEASESFEDAARSQMTKLVRRIHQLISDGVLPDIKFSTELNPGVPEEVILEYTRSTNPVLVVMATRGLNKKHEDLVGSVTAEVLDSCRVPVFTVPENYDFPGVAEITRLAFFCNLDRQDIPSMDLFVRMFSAPEVEICLIPVNDRMAVTTAEAKLRILRDYFATSYPTIGFETRFFSAPTFRQDIENMFNDKRIQLIVVPNKKINIFRRLFNPGIAHRILFERDVPLLALPV